MSNLEPVTAQMQAAIQLDFHFFQLKQTECSLQMCVRAFVFNQMTTVSDGNYEVIPFGNRFQGLTYTVMYNNNNAGVQQNNIKVTSIWLRW